jgi:hypothetical protein
MIKKTTVKTKHQRQFVLEFVLDKKDGDEKSPVLVATQLSTFTHLLSQGNNTVR